LIEEIESMFILMSADLPSGVVAAKAVILAYKPLLTLDGAQCYEIGRSFPIPTFGKDIVMSLCTAARKIFERTDIVTNIAAPFYVIGDIHGNIFDLLRILILAHPPPRSRLLFLGDYVDRGEYSIEVITLLFAFLVKYPGSLVMLRGNHEFESLNKNYGLHSDISAQYSSDLLFNLINVTFSWMPLVAVLSDNIFCVHGGISPRLTSLSQIREIKRPLTSYDSDYVADLVWSDPCADSKTYDDSVRGLGVRFGAAALQSFLTAMNMKTVFRAHQCVLPGVSRFGADQLFTIFSCSRYDGQDNRCGLLLVNAELEIEFFSLPPIEQIPRETAFLKRCAVEQIIQEIQAEESIALSVKLQDIQESAFRTLGKKQGLSIEGRAIPPKRGALTGRPRRLTPPARYVG
jgi:protein phosphatase